MDQTIAIRIVYTFALYTGVYGMRRGFEQQMSTVLLNFRTEIHLSLDRESYITQSLLPIQSRFYHLP
jgi:hypothetical protein